MQIYIKEGETMINKYKQYKKNKYRLMKLRDLYKMETASEKDIGKYVYTRAMFKAYTELTK